MRKFVLSVAAVGAAVIATNPEGYLAQNMRYMRASARWLRKSLGRNGEETVAAPTSARPPDPVPSGLARSDAVSEVQ